MSKFGVDLPFLEDREGKAAVEIEGKGRKS